MKLVDLDELLVTAFLESGDDRLFAEIYNRYHPKVYQSCLSILRDSEEALDQTQEIFCKVYTRLGTFRAEARFSTWLFVLTRHHCLSALGNLKKRTYLPLDSVSDTLWCSVQLDEPTLDERWQRAEQTLGQLSVRDQQLLRRRYLADKDIATLAIEASVSVSALKMRLKRARDQARAIHQQCA